MTETIFHEEMSSSACGKVILAGEHSVLFGHRAVATALPGMDLTLRVCLASPAPMSWSEAFVRRGAPLGPREGALLALALEKALEIVRPGCASKDFVPQRIDVASRLPEGAGLGSSAAFSVALLRLICQALRPNRPPSGAEANELDSLFHGRASGVDVATVLGGGVVEYIQGEVPRAILPPRGFWLVLVDTCTRASTREMVDRVAQLRKGAPEQTDAWLSELGGCASVVAQGLRAGELGRVGTAMARAQVVLTNLGLSTFELQRAVDWLFGRGALGAKQSGSGGGGVALGLFASPVSYSQAQIPYGFQVSQVFVPGGCDGPGSPPST